MYRQEIVHQKTQDIYAHIGETEIKEDSIQWNEFQDSEEPESLGYQFIESVYSRMNPIQPVFDPIPEPED